MLPLRAPSQGDGGGSAAPADDAFSGAGTFFRLSGPQREVLLLVALWAGGYGRGSAQLFDAATLEPLRWAATIFFFGHVLIAAYGTLFVALPRGRLPCRGRSSSCSPAPAGWASCARSRAAAAAAARAASSADAIL